MMIMGMSSLAGRVTHCHLKRAEHGSLKVGGSSKWADEVGEGCK